MGKSGEHTGSAGPGCRDGSGAPGPGMLAVILPRGGLDPGALRDPGSGMERRTGRSARRRSAGSFRGSQEAGVAVVPPGEREGRRDRGRVPRSASQRLRQGGLPGADGINARRPAKACLLHCFRTELGVGKSHQTVTASLAAKWCAPIGLPKDTSSILLSLSHRCPARRLYARLSGSTRVQTPASPYL